MEIINLIFFSQEEESKWVGSFPQMTVLTIGTFVSPFSQGSPQIKKINPSQNLSILQSALNKEILVI